MCLLEENEELSDDEFLSSDDGKVGHISDYDCSDFSAEIGSEYVFPSLQLTQKLLEKTHHCWNTKKEQTRTSTSVYCGKRQGSQVDVVLLSR